MRSTTRQALALAGAIGAIAGCSGRGATTSSAAPAVGRADAAPPESRATFEVVVRGKSRKIVAADVARLGGANDGTDGHGGRRTVWLADALALATPIEAIESASLVDRSGAAVAISAADLHDADRPLILRQSGRGGYNVKRSEAPGDAPKPLVHDLVRVDITLAARPQ